jgi:HAE1 family hydrophobic/amphiphilic exporter-1
MGYAWNALSYQEKLASGGSARVLGLALVFVFLILAALYESWSLPFSVLLSTPVAVLGALVGLVARHFDNNVYAQIGLVMLVGLTAKNAILIVEFAKDKLEAGLSPVDAALAGARLRLRPILMTSLAFIFGCIPLWTAKGAGANAREMLGTAVIAGMLAATTVGIFIIPALFVVIEKATGRRTNAEDAAPESDPSSEILRAAAE